MLSPRIRYWGESTLLGPFLKKPMLVFFRKARRDNTIDCTTGTRLKQQGRHIYIFPCFVLFCYVYFIFSIKILALSLIDINITRQFLCLPPIPPSHKKILLLSTHIYTSPTLASMSIFLLILFYLTQCKQAQVSPMW